MFQFLSSATQLGQLLMSARRRKKLTQAEAAAHAGISQSRLSVLESDPSGLTVAQLLALMALYGLRVAVEDQPADASTAEW
jgi:HTH-type transcriptional regulator/antitoxin HipB